MEYKDDEKGIDIVEEAALKYIRKMTLDEYFKWDEEQLERYEYIDGDVFTFQGASLNHNRILSTLNTRIGSFLEDRPCEVFSNDARIEVRSKNSYLYPDLVIFCDEIKTAGESKNTFTNPSVIIEVLSPSTIQYDRYKKHMLYMQIETLKEYILIDSAKMNVIRNFKEDGPLWVSHESYMPDEHLLIETTGFKLSLEELYRNVKC